MPAMNEFNPLRDAIPLREVKRVLVIKLRHHGDVLLSSPVFSALKLAAPQVEIDALVYADTAEMLSLHPAISRVFEVDRKAKQKGAMHQLKSELDLLAGLRARSYDLILHLTEHWRGAWLSRILRPRWAVGCTRSDAGALWRRSFSHLYKVSGGLPRHTVERNLDALRRIGVWPAPAQRRLVLVPGEAAAAVLLRPREADEPGLVHASLPAPQELVRLGTGHVGALTQPGDPVLGQVLAEPASHLVAEGLLFRGQREIHGPSSGSCGGEAPIPEQRLRRRSRRSIPSITSRQPLRRRASRPVARTKKGPARGTTERRFSSMIRAAARRCQGPSPLGSRFTLYSRTS